MVRRLPAGAGWGVGRSLKSSDWLKGAIPDPSRGGLPGQLCLCLGTGFTHHRFCDSMSLLQNILGHLQGPTLNGGGKRWSICTLEANWMQVGDPERGKTPVTHEEPLLDLSQEKLLLWRWCPVTIRPIISEGSVSWGPERKQVAQGKWVIRCRIEYIGCLQRRGQVAEKQWCAQSGPS